mgnify:CR=1 FL=1
MAFTEDLTQFFDTDDFAVEAIFTLSPSGTRTVKTIFDTPTQSVDIYDSSIEADAPLLRCKTSDLASVKNNANVEIDSTNYKVKRIVNDGTGISIVYLKT